MKAARNHVRDVIIPNVWPLSRGTLTYLLTWRFAGFPFWRAAIFVAGIAFFYFAMGAAYGDIKRTPYLVPIFTIISIAYMTRLHYKIWRRKPHDDE